MAEKVQRLDHFYREAPDSEEMLHADLVDLVNQTVELTRPKWEDEATHDGKRVIVGVRAATSTSVKVVASQLRSVLTNLIFNSVDAIEGSGTVNLKVSSKDGWAVLEVQDDGAGMTREQLDRCLEPFYTSKAKGSGLGLSECHGVVRQHGGSMRVESTQGLGTNVILEFPLDLDGTQDRMGDAEQKQESHRFARVQGSVLLVDDQDQVLRSMAMLLESMGLQVKQASDGKEALQMMRHSAFQLVISDYGLPGLNGGELLKEIKANWPDTPVVIVSRCSYPIPKDELQPDAYLNKPFSVAALSNVVQTIFSQRAV